MSREYDTDTLLYKLGTAALAAVLLTAVAAIGLTMMSGGAWTKSCTLYASVPVLLMGGYLVKTARGSRRYAGTRHQPPSQPAPESSVTRSTLYLVHEATYVDGLHDIRVPLGEAFGLLGT